MIRKQKEVDPAGRGEDAWPRLLYKAPGGSFDSQVFSVLTLAGPSLSD